MTSNTSTPDSIVSTILRNAFSANRRFTDEEITQLRILGPQAQRLDLRRQVSTQAQVGPNEGVDTVCCMETPSSQLEGIHFFNVADITEIHASTVQSRVYPICSPHIPSSQLLDIGFFELTNITEINASGTYFNEKIDDETFPGLKKLILNDGIIFDYCITEGLLDQCISLSLRNAIIIATNSTVSAVRTPLQLCASLDIFTEPTRIQHLDLRNVMVRPAIYSSSSDSTVCTARHQDNVEHFDITRCFTLTGNIITQPYPVCTSHSDIHPLSRRLSSLSLCNSSSSSSKAIYEPPTFSSSQVGISSSWPTYNEFLRTIDESNVFPPYVNSIVAEYAESPDMAVSTILRNAFTTNRRFTDTEIAQLQALGPQVQRLDLRLQVSAQIQAGPNERIYPSFRSHRALAQLRSIGFFDLANITEINASGTYYTLKTMCAFPGLKKLTLDDGMFVINPAPNLRALESLSLRNTIVLPPRSIKTAFHICGYLDAASPQIQQLDMQGVMVAANLDPDHIDFSCFFNGFVRANMSRFRPLTENILA